MFLVQIVCVCSGQLELDDGGGGVLISTASLFGPVGDSANFSFPSTELSGLYECSFGGDLLLLHSSAVGGVRRTTVVSYHDQAKLSGNRGTGSVALIGDDVVVATFRGTGGYFQVRRLA
jgi:hypothetical protein